MILTNLKLKNFRNYNDLDLTFNKKINIFIGNNAQGKTNILESIYVLSLTKSHRTNKDLYLIKQNSLFTKIIGTINDNDIINKYEVLINENGKRVSINDKPLKKVSEYLSKINAIMFCPDDLEIIKGSPQERRSFFNISISGFNNNYVRYLNEYNKILKTRNEYLKNYEIINKDYLDVLTNKLIDLNIYIYNERKKYVETINKYLKNIYKDITGKENIILKYDSFMDNDDRNELEDKFNMVYNNELFQKVTLLGVHKDDFSIFIDDVKINNYGSQGQHRIAILCLKLTEIKIYEEEYDKKPILLLDDIFSELDSTKKTNIIKFIKNDLQVFITSTDLNNIDKKIIKEADIYKIDNGKVVEGE
ncbi:MAG: DNA replication/repair protein RecF [Bacilli bacterium]|nr:DNA replication/repair protein RecF [Bacilli bacterium]